MKKIQPLDPNLAPLRTETAKPAGKSRLKRLFERSVLRTSSSEKIDKDRDVGELEPELSSAWMIVGFIEESNEKPSRCGRRCCNCFHGKCGDESSDDDLDFDVDPPPIPSDAAEILKGLVPCASATERNLLADASRIVEKGKICNGKSDCRRIVTDELRLLGYNASVCVSRWEKTSSFPAGEYEYIDVIFSSGERFLLDLDFRSEFEIVRSTKSYRAVLESLPSIFVGKDDRLRRIIAVVSEAARVNLRKKGLHFPPWRKPEYMRAKWLSPYERTAAVVLPEPNGSPAASGVGFPGVSLDEDSGGTLSPWKLPAVKPKASPAGAKVVTGLASVLREKC